MNRAEKIAAARRIAADGMVLLRNDRNALPLKAGATVALLGVTSYFPHRMGFGSGDMLSHSQVTYDFGLANAGISVSQPFADLYRRHIHEHAGAFSRINRDWGRWTFRFPEPQVTDAGFAALAEGLREMPAIVTIGRNCGESVDMTDSPGSFRLHPEEEELLRRACGHFDTVIVLLNVCGAIDASFLDRYPVAAALVTGLAGETGGDAVADILTGAVTPSGKLAMTWAKRYRDYPTTDCFGTCDVPFHEGVYVGYRYFDSFGVEPRFPFGYGLSYTEFSIRAYATQASGGKVSTRIEVENTGKAKGAAVIQAYLSPPAGGIEKPRQSLCAYAKSNVITPGGKERLAIEFDIADFASYCPKAAAFALEPGDYLLRIGESSRDTHVAAVLRLPRRVEVFKTVNRLAIDESGLGLISCAGAEPFRNPGEDSETEAAPVVALRAAAIAESARKPCPPARMVFRRKAGAKCVTLRDVRDGKALMGQFIAQLSDFELASCVNGMIFDEPHADGVLSGVGGTSDLKVKTRGEGAEIWHGGAYGIPASNCQDGPSGVRLGIFGEDPDMDSEAARLCVSYPCSTLVAQTWNVRHALALGRCIQSDMRLANIDGWLGAGVNIQRNPLCGRNFEYLSEDPMLGGTMSGMVMRGVQTLDDGSPSGLYATMKHFAVNSQEFERVGQNNVVSERALREIYLKSFEWGAKVGRPLAVMTSYNRLNGDFTAVNRDLIQGILREEWGFDGLVMTDWWNGADPLLHCAAGGDIQMPGVKAKRDAIAEALASGKIDRKDVRACAARIMDVVMRTSFEQK